MTAQSSQLEDIARTLGFTLDELALNRTGQISARQSWENVRLAAWGMGLIVAVIVAILVLVFIIKPTGILRLVNCLFLIPGFLVVSYIGCVWIRGVIERRVLVTEGSLSFHGAGRGPPTMVIGQARVPAPPHANAVLTENTPYRVFYLAHSRIFLSIEPFARTHQQVEGIPDEPFRADSREPNEDANPVCRGRGAGPDGNSWRVGVAGKEA